MPRSEFADIQSALPPWMGSSNISECIMYIIIKAAVESTSRGSLTLAPIIDVRRSFWPPGGTALCRFKLAQDLYNLLCICSCPIIPTQPRHGQPCCHSSIHGPSSLIIVSGPQTRMRGHKGLGSRLLN